MKKLRLISFIVVCLMPPSVCNSSYIIRLTSGAEFVTSKYWEEEGQIKFYLYGGTMGVSKHLVANVFDSDRPVVAEMQEARDKKTPSELNPDKKNPSGPEDMNAANKDAKGASPPVDPHRQIFLQKKARLTSEMEAAVSDFREAKKRNDRSAMEAKRKQILSLKAEFTALEKEIEKGFGGKLPDWWQPEETTDSAD